jgi:site-specific recombinase XerD
VTGVGTINSNGLVDTFEAHLSRLALAPATVANYLADLRAFLRWSETTNGQDCSPFNLGGSDIENFCAYLQEVKGQAPATINRRIQALRKFYTLAMDQGWTGNNPAEGVSLRCEMASERSRSLTADDVDRLLAAVERSRSSRAVRDWAVVQLLLKTGLKLGELTELRLDDLDLEADEPCLEVRGLDGGPGRTIPLDQEAHAAVVKYLETREAAPGVESLCVNRDGNPLSTRSVQRLLHHYAQAAGLDGLTTQALRYLYAREVYELSGDLKTVARHLGHRHLATTVRYLRPGSPGSPEI